MKLKKILAVLVGLAAVAVAILFVMAWRPAIEPVAPPRRAAFDQALIQRGAVLAAVGNCTACHTQPGGHSFAGGLALPTPFGTIYSSNITPDPETGIGAWSEAAFGRAMRQGVGRDGRHLYPAFPFDHFTQVSDEDNRALYAFLMTRPPVRQTTPGNDLPFPLNHRALLAGWKLLFFREGPFQDVASQSAEWNRGAYLVDGLGHCGACHTPRNALGAEKAGLSLAGGQAEGWTAFALDAHSPAPTPWTKDSLFAYLRQGWHPEHGVASGPMAEVTGNLGLLPDADIRAISTYIAARMGPPSPDRRPASGKPPARAVRGEAIYQAACAACHDGSRPLPFGGIDLRLSSTVHAPDAQNAINTVLFGLPAASGRPSPIMPGFAATLTDAQLADLLAYLREAFAGQPAWQGVAASAADTRSGKFQVSVRPSDGIERGPDHIGAKD